jgi:hypothetical protein
MSPHIIIDTAIEGLEELSSLVGHQIMVQRIITKAFNEKLITREECDHYSGRLTRVVGRQARKAA